MSAASGPATTPAVCARLETIAWGEEHFGSLITNRQFPRRVMMRLVRDGLAESVGSVDICDGDGFLAGNRQAEGFRLTRAGWERLCERFPDDRDYREGLANYTEATAHV